MGAGAWRPVRGAWGDAPRQYTGLERGVAGRSGSLVAHQWLELAADRRQIALGAHHGADVAVGARGFVDEPDGPVRIEADAVHLAKGKAEEVATAVTASFAAQLGKGKLPRTTVTPVTGTTLPPPQRMLPTS